MTSSSSPSLAYAITREPCYQPRAAGWAVSSRRRPPAGHAQGPTGCGRRGLSSTWPGSWGVHHLCTCSEDAAASDGWAALPAGDNGTRWLDGPLTQAARMGAICYLDEIVEARRDTTVVIHPLTDHRRSLPLDKGQTGACPPDSSWSFHQPRLPEPDERPGPSTKQRLRRSTSTIPRPSWRPASWPAETGPARSAGRPPWWKAGHRRPQPEGHGLDEAFPPSRWCYAATADGGWRGPRDACRMAMVRPSPTTRTSATRWTTPSMPCSGEAAMQDLLRLAHAARHPFSRRWMGCLSRAWSKPVACSRPTAWRPTCNTPAFWARWGGAWAAAHVSGRVARRGPYAGRRRTARHFDHHPHAVEVAQRQSHQPVLQSPCPPWRGGCLHQQAVPAPHLSLSLDFMGAPPAPRPPQNLCQPRSAAVFFEQAPHLLASSASLAWSGGWNTASAVHPQPPLNASANTSAAKRRCPRRAATRARGACWPTTPACWICTFRACGPAGPFTVQLRCCLTPGRSKPPRNASTRSDMGSSARVGATGGGVVARWAKPRRTCPAGATL